MCVRARRTFPSPTHFLVQQQKVLLPPPPSLSLAQASCEDLRAEFGRTIGYPPPAMLTVEESTAGAKFHRIGDDYIATYLLRPLCRCLCLSVFLCLSPSACLCLSLSLSLCLSVSELPMHTPEQLLPLLDSDHRASHSVRVVYYSQG